MDKIYISNVYIVRVLSNNMIIRVICAIGLCNIDEFEF